MQGVTVTHRPDNNPTTVRNKSSLPAHDIVAAIPSLVPTRRMSIVGGDNYIPRRRNTLLPIQQQLQQQDSARVIRVVSRDDLLVRIESSIALGTGQARNMTTIGTVRYRPSRSQPSKETKLENTYRLEPLLSFRSSRAEEIIRSVFKDIFASASAYPDKPEETRHLVKMAANEIRNRTRMLNCDRYKIVVLVNIGQRGGQSVRVASRCLWAVTVDTWASATYEARNLFAVGTVFAIYTE